MSSGGGGGGERKIGRTGKNLKGKDKEILGETKTVGHVGSRRKDGNSELEICCARS